MNYKSYTVLSMALAMLFSCEKPILNEEDANDTPKTITFQLFSPAQARTTRSAAAITDFKKIYIYDSKGGYQEQLLEQSADDPDFGSPTLTLSGGNHQLSFVATDNADAYLDGSVLRQETMGDTFLKSIEINTQNAPANQRIVLERVVAGILYKGEGTVTLSGLRNSLVLSSGKPSKVTTTKTLSTGQQLYTLVPDDETVVMDDKRNIHILQNAITVIYDNDGTHTDPEDPTNGEYLLTENDTAQIYVARMELTDITLENTPDPQAAYAAQMYPYRMPTRREAYGFVKKELPEDFWTGARCLAYDRPEDKNFMGATGWGSGDYYTFTWGPNGTSNKAGTKTAYSIKPIRVVPIVPISQLFTLDGDFTWSTDTTTVVKF